MKTFRLSVCEVLTMIALIVIALCVTAVPTLAMSPHADSDTSLQYTALYLAPNVHQDIAGLSITEPLAKAHFSDVACGAGCNAATPSYAPVGKAQGPVRAGVRRAGGRVRRWLSAPVRLFRGC